MDQTLNTTTILLAYRRFKPSILTRGQFKEATKKIKLDIEHKNQNAGGMEVYTIAKLGGGTCKLLGKYYSKEKDALLKPASMELKFEPRTSGITIDTILNYTKFKNMEFYFAKDTSIWMKRPNETGNGTKLADTFGRYYCRRKY